MRPAPLLTRWLSAVVAAILALQVVVAWPANDQRIFIALYGYPGAQGGANGDFNNAYRAIENHPELTFEVVVNPAGGPGDYNLPDANWLDAIQRLTAYPNTIVLGYIRTYYTYGNRDNGPLIAQINRYAGWGPYSGGAAAIDGVFLDDAPWQGSLYDAFKPLADATRAAPWRTESFLYLNPGCPMEKPVFDLADRVMVVELPASGINTVNLYHVPGLKQDRQSVMVYNTPQNQFSNVSALFVNVGVGSMGLSGSQDLYNDLGSFYPALIDAIADNINKRRGYSYTKPSNAGPPKIPPGKTKTIDAPTSFATAAVSQWARYEETSAFVVKNGTWVPQSSGTMLSYQLFASYSVGFEGVGIRLTGTSDKDHGFVSVAIDGNIVAPQVSTYSSSPANLFKFFEVANLPFGKHIVTVTILPWHPANSPAIGHEFAYFEVLGGVPTVSSSKPSPSSTSPSTSSAAPPASSAPVVRSPSATSTALPSSTPPSSSAPASQSSAPAAVGWTRYEDTDSSVSLGYGWSKLTGNSAYSGGTYTGSRIAGSSLTISFTGVGIELYGDKGYDHGLFSVYLDGSLTQTDVSGFADNQKFNQLLWSINGLSNGPHSLSISIQSSMIYPMYDRTFNLDYFRVQSAGLAPPASSSKPPTPASSSSSPAPASSTAPPSSTANPPPSSTAPPPANTSSAPVQPSPTSTPTDGSSIWTKYEETDPAAIYGAGWTKASLSGASGGTYTWSGTYAASFGIKFTGTGVELYGTKGPNYGYYIIYVDGAVAQRDVSAYSNVLQNNQLLFSKTGLSNGPHTVQLLVRGSRVALSTGVRIGFDYFRVQSAYRSGTTPSLSPARSSTTAPSPPAASGGAGWSSNIENTDPSIDYAGGTWTKSATDSNASGGTYTSTNVNFATVAFTFTGVGFEVFGMKWTDHGSYAVYLDDRLQQTNVPASSSSKLYQQSLYRVTGLTNAKHRVVLVNLDRPGPSENNLDVDFYRVLQS